MVHLRMTPMMPPVIVWMGLNSISLKWCISHPQICRIIRKSMFVIYVTGDFEVHNPDHNINVTQGTTMFSYSKLGTQIAT